MIHVDHAFKLEGAGMSSLIDGGNFTGDALVALKRMAYAGMVGLVVTMALPSALAAAPAHPKVFRDKLSDGSMGPEMVVIPAGSFDMGTTGAYHGYHTEKPVHHVTIDKPFALGKTEVTQRQWRQVMGGDPLGLKFKGCDDCPVEGVSWNDIQAFLKRLNGKTGRNYHLPSEAQWEYACRAGKTGENYCGGNDSDTLAWTDSNSGGKTHPVGQKQENAWGLYDMSGNVREWVQDVWHGDYSGAPTDGSAWTAGGDQGRRMQRGGSWYDVPWVSRSGFRDQGGTPPDYATDDNGFRLARTLP